MLPCLLQLSVHIWHIYEMHLAINSYNLDVLFDINSFPRN